MADIWSLGILVYAMVNPNLSYPYSKELESLGVAFNSDTMRLFMQQQQLPKHDPKYEVLRVTEWWQLEEIFHLCANFVPTSRPTASEVFHIVCIDESEASFVVKNLKVSQNTALEEADLEHALQLRDAKGNVGESSAAVEQLIPENDGTNACVFLAMGIGDAFLREVEKTDCFTWDNLVSLAEEVTTNLPLKINNQRDPSKFYEPSEAKSILKKNELLTVNYELSEECLSAKGVFSESGRQELFDALETSNQQPGTKYRAGLYTCSPYTFLVGIHDDSYFVVDTHPIHEELGGNGNGMLVATHDLTPRSCTLLVQWILKRLKVSGLSGSEVQSFAWLMPLEIQDTESENGDNENSSESRVMQDPCYAGLIDQEIATSYVSVLSGENNDIHDERLETKEASNSVASARSPSSTDSDSNSHEQDEVADKHAGTVLYKGDAITPVFSRENTAYSCEDLVEILLGEYDAERLCVSTPINIAHNVTFLINNSKITSEHDIKCDDMGAWTQNGSPKRCFKVQRNEFDEVVDITPADDDEHSSQPEIYTLKRVYYVNKSSNDVRKIISTLQDWNGDQLATH